MIDRELVSILACPVCRGDLNVAAETVDGILHDGELVCASCRATYPIREGLPDLIPHALLSTSQWQLWEDHLEGLQARRQQRVERDDRLVNRLASGSHSGTKDAFCRFTGIGSGRVLDVGCGTGRIRHGLDRYAEGRVQYVGIDPIPLPEASEFPFVRGVAEHLPFKDDTFAHLIVTSSLDHFSDPDRFFEEVVRVLAPEGRFHLLQSVHELSGPIKAARTLAHLVKDRLERRQTTVRNTAAPKHLTEFNRATILRALGGRFEVTAQRQRAARWYAPTKLFVTLRPLARQPS